MTSQINHRIFISAHSGNCDLPHLSVAESYKRAIDLNVDYIEFDVRRTKDGTYVICHDEDTPSKRLVRELSYEAYKNELGEQAFTVPELLLMAKGKVGLHLDLKETGYEDDIVRLALDSLTTNKLMITTLEDESVRAIKETFPSKDFPMLKVGLSLGRDPRGISFFKQISLRLSEFFPKRRIQATSADFVAVHYLLAKATVLQYCARKQIPAWVWTVDNERDMIRFLNDPRVTTLITNKPSVAIALRTTTASSSETTAKD